MDKVTITLSVGQAYATRDALDLYSRVCIGQIEELAWLIRCGVVTPVSDADTSRKATATEIERVEALLYAVKASLGYPRHGSHGVGHPHVHVSGHRAYEVKKVLAKALAEHANPQPGFRGVDYDGLLVRYTQDAAPAAAVQGADVVLELTADQAHAVCQALDLYQCVCRGQFRALARLVSDGTLPMAGAPRELRLIADELRCADIAALLGQAEALLGYAQAGDRDIRHPHVDESARQAQEVKGLLCEKLSSRGDA